MPRRAHVTDQSVDVRVAGRRRVRATRPLAAVESRTALTRDRPTRVDAVSPAGAHDRVPGAQRTVLPRHADAAHAGLVGRRPLPCPLKAIVPEKLFYDKLKLKNSEYGVRSLAVDTVTLFISQCVHMCVAPRVAPHTECNEVVTMRLSVFVSLPRVALPTERRLPGRLRVLAPGRPGAVGDVMEARLRSVLALGARVLGGLFRAREAVVAEGADVPAKRNGLLGAEEPLRADLTRRRLCRVVRTRGARYRCGRPVGAVVGGGAFVTADGQP